MSEKNKVLYKQAQIAGLGLIILIVGLVYQRKDLMGIGILFFLYGLVRSYLIWKVLKKAEED